MFFALTLVLAVANVYAGQATQPYQRGFVWGPDHHPFADVQSGMRTVVRAGQATQPYQRGYDMRQYGESPYWTEQGSGMSGQMVIKAGQATQPYESGFVWGPGHHAFAPED